MRRRTPKPTGRRRGRLELWVSLRFRRTVAGRTLQNHVLFLEPPKGKQQFESADHLHLFNYTFSITAHGRRNTCVMPM